MAAPRDDQPVDRGPDQFASNARAIAADALPAPTTTVRPATGAGMCAATARAGSAAASAASNKPRKIARIALFSPAFTATPEAVPAS